MSKTVAVQDPVTLSGLVCLCWDIFESEHAWSVQKHRQPLIAKSSNWDTYMCYRVVLNKFDP